MRALLWCCRPIRITLSQAWTAPHSGLGPGCRESLRRSWQPERSRVFLHREISWVELSTEVPQAPPGERAISNSGTQFGEISRHHVLTVGEGLGPLQKAAGSTLEPLFGSRNERGSVDAECCGGGMQCRRGESASELDFIGHTTEVMQLVPGFIQQCHM